MRSVSTLTALLFALALATAADAARIGLDNRNYQELNDLLASGSDFDELRTLLTSLGHTIVPVSSFDSAALATANIAALYLSQSYTQSGGAYGGTEITDILAFVAGGGGLVLHADGGFGTETASMDSLAGAFGVSFAGIATEDDGHEILSFNAHPVTAGLGPLPGSGFCVDFQRILTIAPPAIDLTTFGPLLIPADNALAAVGTVAGAPGNVVIVSDTTAFKDADVSIDAGLGECGNTVAAENIVNFVVPIPEPGTLALLSLGLAGLAARRARRARLLALGCAVALGAVAAEPARAACTGTAEQCADGAFGTPFAEPTLLGLPTTERCVEDQEGELRCKITAGTLVALPDDRFLYWNALEGTENVETSLVAEFGYVTTNDQSRLLTLAPLTDAPSWAHPSPVDGGAVSNPGGYGPCDPNPTDDVPPDNEGADAALFCSDQKMLHDGRILAAGGTDYYDDTCVDWNAALPPGITPFPPGGTELEGIKNARIFDPATNEWTQTDSMDFGRWYPAAVTLPDGDVFIASGVTRLVKPVYPDRPMASGRNVVETETYDTACGTWSYNGTSGERSLPLFPRLHLLPNGHVYFNSAGQAFNPFGQAYDQFLWNIVASYNPVTKSWTDLGVAGVDLDTPMSTPGRRLPRLDLLGDADAETEPARCLHRGEVSDCRRGVEQLREPEPRGLYGDDPLPGRHAEPRRAGAGLLVVRYRAARRAALVRLRDAAAERAGAHDLGRRPRRGMGTGRGGPRDDRGALRSGHEPLDVGRHAAQQAHLPQHGLADARRSRARRRPLADHELVHVLRLPPRHRARQHGSRSQLRDLQPVVRVP